VAEPWYETDPFVRAGDEVPGGYRRTGLGRAFGWRPRANTRHCLRVVLAPKRAGYRRRHHRGGVERREERWTRAWLQAEVERRAVGPGDRLLAVFDVFDEWFHTYGFEGCSFINVLLEIDDDTHPVHIAAVEHLATIRAFLRGLAEQTGVGDQDGFSRQWHMLMKGSIVAAAEGDTEAAQRAKKVAALLLAHELDEPSAAQRVTRPRRRATSPPS
jgi:hypothetical protein